MPRQTENLLDLLLAKPKLNIMRKLTLAGLLILFTITVAAQKKQYDSLMDALMSGTSLKETD